MSDRPFWTCGECRGRIGIDCHCVPSEIGIKLQESLAMLNRESDEEHMAKLMAVPLDGIAYRDERSLDADAERLREGLYG